MSSEEAERSTAADLVVVRDGFVPRTDVAPPDPSATPSITLTHFEALARSDVSIVDACYRASSPGWNTDVDELVEHRLVDLAFHFGGLVGDSAGLHVVATETVAGVTTQRLAGDTMRARTWLGFRDGTPTACVLACAPAAHDGVEACASLVEHAHLRPPLDASPPREGMILGAVRTMVHHPGATAAGFLGLLVAVSFVVVLRRPKRRRRTHF